MPKPNFTRPSLYAGAAVAALLGAHAAKAQPVGQFLTDRLFAAGVPGYGPEQGVTVLSRERPDYDPEGVRAGSFIIRPQLTESLGYDDNVLGLNDSRGSFDVDTQAQVAANSDWGRNSLGALVSVDDRRLPGLSSQDRTDFGATLGGTYEIGRDVLAIGGSFQQVHQDPTQINALVPGLSNNSQYSTQPTPYTLADVTASYTAPFGRFSLIPSAEYTQLRFSNLKLITLDGAPHPTTAGDVFVLPGGVTVPISQNYRNRDIVQGAAQLRYEFSPLRDAVFEVRDINTNYGSHEAAAFGPARSSNGIEGLVGLDYVASAVWRYRVLIGVEARDFNSPQYKDHTAPIGEADVIWSPSGLTTVTGRVSKTIEDASNENAAGYDYTSGLLRIDHEYLRNVLLDAYVGAQYAAYLQSQGNETLYQAGLGGTYLVNRNIRLSLTWDLTDRQGSQSIGPNYLQNIYLLKARFAL